jgi:large subunit ribosomal protein L13
MAKPETVTRAWHVLDAAGTPLGRTAAQAAVLLRGKHKPEFTPHVDTGDFVAVVNAEKAVLTGRKLEQKFYRTHSGYVGGLKETKYRLLMRDRPDFALRLAVRGMLPKNTLGRAALNRLKVYRGPEHPHAAQKPVVYGATE